MFKGYFKLQFQGFGVSAFFVAQKNVTITTVADVTSAYNIVFQTWRLDTVFVASSF